MYIPEEKVSEILTASDIVDIVSENVILKKSGRNFFGLCPFHSEKTPSFSVNPSKQIFHCFGCSAGGNSISFVMKYHGISFPEALRMLARKYQIQIDIDSVDPAVKKAFLVKEGLFRLNKKVMQYYSDFLKTDTQCDSARQYLKNRKITDQTIDQFRLGFSKDSWDSIVTFIRSTKVAKQTAVQSGLILERKQKTGYYDRFRNRIMFPIFDINMQVAGFGGRVMDDSMPKYMNSPETPVYNKSRILYGLHAAKQYCRQNESVFIVEGYFDFLSLYQHGIKNTVATLGTALTEAHIRILKGYAKKMILVYDSDDAGINAAKRSISLFLNEGIDTRILVLPDDNDPDSYVMEHGKTAFLELADQADTVMQFLLELSKKTHGLSIEGRANILKDIKPYLGRIEDSALRSLYVRELSEQLGIDEKAVLEKVREQYVNHQNKQASLDLSEMSSEMHDEKKDSDPREEQLVSMMLNYPQIIPEVIQTGVIESFYSNRLKRVAQVIVNSNFKEKAFITNAMAAMKNEEDRKLAAGLGMNEFHLEDDIESAALSIMNRIIRVRRKTENKLTNKIISARKGSDAEMMELLKLKQTEIQQLHNN